MSTSGQELLKSFDRLPEIEKREVASEIMRRTFAPDQKVVLDEARVAALYAESTVEDRELAEEGMESYGRDLSAEDDS